MVLKERPGVKKLKAIESGKRTLMIKINV